MNDNVKLVKVFSTTENALPEQSTPLSAAKDIRADIGMVKDKFIFGGSLTEVPKGITTGDYPYDQNQLRTSTKVKALILYPGGRALIPSGLQMAMPEGYSMDVRPRSGLALKYGITLTNSPGLIDEDYRGDVGCIVANTGMKSVIIIDGDRIGQIKLVADVTWSWKQVDSAEQLGDTIRGAGGFNSTGTK